MLITSMSTDRIGRHEVLLPINYNHYNFGEKKCTIFCERAFNSHYQKLEKISLADTLSLQALETPQFGFLFVAIVIVINSVVGG